MLKFFKRSNNTNNEEKTKNSKERLPPTPIIQADTHTKSPISKAENLQSQNLETSPSTSSEEHNTKKKGLLARLSGRLKKTRQGLTEGLATAVVGKKIIDDELLETLETQLLIADIGVEASQKIIDNLTQQLSRKVLKNPTTLLQSLQDDMKAMLKPVTKPLLIDTQKKPFVILVTGINGAGKTTTIGKLAKQLQQQGKRVMLAAGDTFRAAAVEQLQVWGERNEIAVIAQAGSADSAAVIFDAMSAAKARGIDVLLADTAGRLHTQDHLMSELKKIKRVMQKHDVDAPHETLLVLDAGNGQNALMQAKHFHQAIGVDGICLTKLDGTAKGGIIFAIAEQTHLPIRFIGVGESIDDLQVFQSDSFVDALFDGI